ncbi:hypothetical protein KJ671_03475, partial [Patescibacteria group bacterium]|nr:hypothetical protein [Patescibacteria group bacterium]
LYNPWCEKFGYQADDVLNILVKCGYKCFYASQKALIKINNITNENDVYNYFFLHENKHNAIISKLS